MSTFSDSEEQPRRAEVDGEPHHLAPPGILFEPTAAALRARFASAGDSLCFTEALLHTDKNTSIPGREISNVSEKNLSKNTLHQHKLLMDGEARQKFLDAERTEIETHYSHAPQSLRQWRLAEQTQWLDGWYEQLPETDRQKLEEENNLLVGADLLPRIHPSLIIGEIENKQLDALFLNHAYTIGMDTAVTRLFREQHKPFIGLETERDRLEAGGFSELRQQIQGFMNPRFSTPIQVLQDHVKHLQTPEKGGYYALQDIDCNALKETISLATQDYFYGRVLEQQPSESAIKRTQNWKPKIHQIASTHSCPWLMLVGLDHARGDQGLLPWFQGNNWDVERFSNQGSLQWIPVSQ